MRLFKIVLTTILVTLSTYSTASGWGVVDDIDVPEVKDGYLATSILDTSKIKYCLDLGDASQFREESIALQVEAALKVWLAPVQSVGLIGEVLIEEVPCSDSQLQLQVKAISGIDYNIGKHEIRQALGRQVSNVMLFSDFNYKGFSLTDFATLTGETQLSQVLEVFASASSYPIRTFANERQLEWATIRFSTYAVILHELGHSFGLCDTKLVMFGNCKGNDYKDGPTRDTVMSDASHLTLTPDDKTGIINIFYNAQSSRQLRGQ